MTIDRVLGYFAIYGNIGFVIWIAIFKFFLPAMVKPLIELPDEPSWWQNLVMYSVVSGVFVPWLYALWVTKRDGDKEWHRACSWLWFAAPYYLLSIRGNSVEKAH
jgi:hypothetical protein